MLNGNIEIFFFVFGNGVRVWSDLNRGVLVGMRKLRLVLMGEGSGRF